MWYHKSSNSLGKPPMFAFDNSCYKNSLQVVGMSLTYYS